MPKSAPARKAPHLSPATATAPDTAPSAHHDLPLIVLLAAATSLVIGLIWDISWDASIGKDSFWSPPHFAINFGGLIAWLAGLWAVVQATRANAPGALHIGKLRVPLGAALTLWGGCAMLTSGALDLWWTRAYGLFSGFWAPPQILFTAGISAVLTGVLFRSISWRNGIFIAAVKAPGKTSKPTAAWRQHLPTVWAAGLMLTFAAAATVQYNLPNLQRTALFYTISCPLYAFILTWTAQAAGFRWATTLIALIYTMLMALLVWIFPLFPAAPLIGPVYQPITHLLPPQFPLLLAVPALFADLLLRRIRRDAWMQFIFTGAIFAGVFMITQWLFAGFLLSSAADNWFFAGGAKHWPFYMQVGPEGRQFWGQEQSPLTAGAVALCGLLTIAATRLGLWTGRWSCRLRK